MQASAERTAISPTKLAKPVGPYSHGVKASGFVFCSGQLALDEGSSAPLAELSVGEQTRVVLRNLQSTLEAAGSSLESVVRTTIYVTDLADYPAVNEAYQEFFRPPFPARATIEVKALIGGLAVEIDAIGILEQAAR